MTTDKNKRIFRVTAEDFKKIPGSPIGYWIGSEMLRCLDGKNPLDNSFSFREGIHTADNDRFLKLWFEISFIQIVFNASCYNDIDTRGKYVPYNKGGEFRKWYGNNEYVIGFNREKRDEMATLKGHVRPSQSLYFQEGGTWSSVSSGSFGIRYYPGGYLFDAGGQVAVGDDIHSCIAYLNSSLFSAISVITMPTINFKCGVIKTLPDLIIKSDIIRFSALSLEEISHNDWDSFEISWDFQNNPLIDAQKRCEEKAKIYSSYLQLREEWRKSCEEMRRLEVENNRIFIEAYGLQDELSPEVPWNEITLTCNPWYRYGKSPADFDRVENSFYVSADGRIGTTSTTENGKFPKTSLPFTADLEQRLLEDTIKEFISYAVGCMMGRYSFDKPGLILANQGESFFDYLRKISDNDSFRNPDTPENLNTTSALASANRVVGRDPYRKIPNRLTGKDVTPFADVDGVLPILDDEWFMDDIVAQFKAFLTLTFGEEHFAQNLQFIEGALGKDIRKYFVRDFYKDHIQRYKKRPIYWLFSSPKGSFNALIYMHRYRPDTVSIVLNDYLREYMTKLHARREHLIAENNRADLSGPAKTRNLKLIDKYAAMLAELEAYERDVLFPLAQKKIAIDLDDGVKVNYCKFGDALKKIPGLEAKEE